MLTANRLSFRYGAGAPYVLRDVALSIHPGEIVGLSGPSGRGKSTLGRLLAGHLEPTSGTITIDDRAGSNGQFHPVQYLHQSPIFATDPRWRISRIIAEGWSPDEVTRTELGIDDSWYARYPHEVSGGELQRVALLRALAPGLRYLIADEITSMLDPVAQVEIWQILLKRVRQGLGILAISHDRALLERIATRVVTI
ncbi:MAG: ATP-binding cassette domain-containing protein [Rhodobacteraceae bacterium]|nr:ATP-binding cassette domain-containing protein [Paracoccaceae bacterium]